MNTELFDTAIELAERVAESYRDNSQLDYLGMIGETLESLAVQCGIPPLGPTQIDHIIRALEGKPNHPPIIHRLCNQTTGEPIDYSPDATFDAISDVQMANAEMVGSGLVWRSERDIEGQREREAAEAKERNRWHITHEERLALAEFYREHGRTWKAKLRAAWERGDAPPMLQYLATHKCFGPAGLARYKTKHLAELIAS
jgi:hypothetical protein